MIVVGMTIALANPTARTAGRTPIGEMRVKTDTIRMVHEDLEIRLLDFDEYEVRATYQLNNPAAEAVVRFEVPITSGGADGDSRDSNAAASVRILSAGNFVPCLVGEGEPMKTPYTMMGGTVDRWCSADLVVPPGLSEIRLSYEGEMLFSRPQSAQDLLPRGADRRLAYALFPAASWNKKPDTVAITVDLGPYADRATVIQPKGSENSGRIVSWSLDKPDFEKTPWLDIVLKAADKDQHRIVTQFNAADNAWKPASTKVGGQDVSGPLSDHDAATAWCGESGSTLQLEWPVPHEAARAGESCRAGIVHVPGDASSPERWGAAAPQTYTLATCEDEGPKQPVPIRRAKHPEHSGQVTPLDSAMAEAFFAPWRSEEPAEAGSCVQLTVEGASEVCIAELGWLVSCP